jgi:hypothetical protein
MYRRNGLHLDLRDCIDACLETPDCEYVGSGSDGICRLFRSCKQHSEREVQLFQRQVVSFPAFGLFGNLVNQGTEQTNTYLGAHNISNGLAQITIHMDPCKTDGRREDMSSSAQLTYLAIEHGVVLSESADNRQCDSRDKAGWSYCRKVLEANPNACDSPEVRAHCQQRCEPFFDFNNDYGFHGLPADDKAWIDPKFLNQLAQHAR